VVSELFGLRQLAPGYIEAVWNVPALSGVLVYCIPLEELLFGLTFGLSWSSVYEHVMWHTGVMSQHPRRF
jgi:lycopene cyclase-like protein